MFQKIKKRIDNMNELTKTRLFALLVTIIMISAFIVIHKNKNVNYDNDYTHRHYRHWRG